MQEVSWDQQLAKEGTEKEEQAWVEEQGGPRCWLTKATSYPPHGECWGREGPAEMFQVGMRALAFTPCVTWFLDVGA